MPSDKSRSSRRYGAKEVAVILGVDKMTLFNWEVAGKIPRAKRDPMNNYRYYTEQDVWHLRKITKR